jgi:hypothetical protein
LEFFRERIKDHREKNHGKFKDMRRVFFWNMYAEGGA